MHSLLASYVSLRNVFFTQHAVLALLSQSDVLYQANSPAMKGFSSCWLRPTSFFVDLFTHYENNKTHYEAKPKCLRISFVAGACVTMPSWLLPVVKVAKHSAKSRQTYINGIAPSTSTDCIEPSKHQKELNLSSCYHRHISSRPQFETAAAALLSKTTQSCS